MRLLNGAYEVLEKALDPSRARRYADFETFGRDLDGIAFYEQKHGDRTYRRLQFVGKGGFGEVFKARWVEKNVDVAVKQLLNAEYARRFHLEAKVMKELQDPCFVKFIDFYETSDHAFLVMKFLEGMPGSSLRDAINRAHKGGIPKNLVLPAFERYARGLSLMHRRNIIHRDIKPSNLYYPPGRPDLVAIMDLGIVKADDSSFTSGMAPCTFDYAPPELVLTKNRGGPGMDIYALGLCMYEALTGRQGYPRIPTGTAGMMAFFERSKSLRKPAFDDPMVTGDPELLALLRKMTAPKLSERYQDADEVAIAIRKLFYRQAEDDDCPPTQVFSPETVPTRPIDEKRLMEWYREWVKVHPEAMETPVVPEPERTRRWGWLLLTGLVSAFISVVGVILVQQMRQVEPTKPPPVRADVPPAPRPPPLPDPTVIALRRQLFERDFAGSLADEPVANRRKRLADAATLLAQARKDGLYDDETRWKTFEKELETALAAAVGKIRNACGCVLTVDGSALAVGEVRLFRFADGKCGDRRMAIFGHDERAVPEDLDGKTIEVSKSDFSVSRVTVVLPELEGGVECRFLDKRMTGGQSLLLLPGEYRCEYRRRGYESQRIPFAVELGRGRSFPIPGKWEPSLVDVSLPKLESGVQARFDNREIRETVRLPPGKYKIEYARTGYDSQTHDFVVELATPLTLPVPGEWKVSRVKVMLPELPADVICRIDGTECSSSVDLFPGSHVSEFVRRGFSVVSNSFAVALATPMSLSAPKSDDWKALPVIVTLPSLSADITLSVDGARQPHGRTSTSLMPGSHKIRFSRANHHDLDSELTVIPGTDTAIAAPDSQKWIPKPIERPKPKPKPQPQPQPEPQTVSPEIRKLLSDARFYFDDGDFELTVKNFHAAYVKGYRLDANDMNVFESAYRKRRDYLKGRIDYLERQEFRKTQNLRDIEEHREKLRQLGEWYRAVKQI